MTVCLLTVVAFNNSQAVGTPAGTSVSNTAVMTYFIDGVPLATQTNAATFTVAELSGFTVTWQDASNVAVIAGQTERILTYEIANIGNGADTFDISVSATTGIDDFDVTATVIYLDTDGDGIFNIAFDTLLISGVNDPALNQDETIKIFVVSTIPAVGVNDGDISINSVSVASKTAIGPYGTVINGGGDIGSDLVIGQNTSASSSDGTYEVTSAVALIDKTVTVLDLGGGSEVLTDSILTYSLSVTVSGSSTVTSLVITDPIPAGTTYTASSLKLNGASLTDVSDGDVGDVGATTPDTVTVTLPDMTSASGAQVITFEVVID